MKPDRHPEWRALACERLWRRREYQAAVAFAEFQRGWLSESARWAWGVMV